MDQVMKLLGEGLVLSGLGGVIALERRCLGQMALAQPLLLCVVAGWFSSQPELGLWLGLSLQLFSLLPRRGLDWSSAGLCASVTMYLCPSLGVEMAVGSPSSVVVLLVAASSILITSVLDRAIASNHALRLERAAPWSQDDARSQVVRFVHGALWRQWLFGSIALTVYTALALFLAALLSAAPVAAPWTVELAAVGAPLLAMAVALGSMAQPRRLVWSLAGAAVGLGALLI